jgi:hypothetical protein
MYSNETELKEEVRSMTGYTSTLALSNVSLNTAYHRAKRRIHRQKTLETPYGWYDSDKVASQDALFWFTCLFVKMETGELDSPGLQAGAVDMDDLLANDDGNATMWYSQAQNALDQINAGSIIKSTNPIRNDRTYEPASFDDGSGGGSGTEVDNTDI